MLNTKLIYKGMENLIRQGAMVVWNDEKLFYEVQKIDDVEEYMEEHPIYANIPQLETDQQAREVAKKFGLRFINEEEPNKIANYYYNNGKEITIQFDNYGDEGRNLGELMDWLGEVASIVQANELYQFACVDDSGNIFDFTNQDEYILARNGVVTVEYSGKTLEDYKDTEPTFYKWYYNE